MTRASGARRAAPLLLPAYAWLALAVFLPLSAMAFFSLVETIPRAGEPWVPTLAHYRAFADGEVYRTLLLRSLRLGIEVTVICLVVGVPCAIALARAFAGRARETLFLLVILPFWSNALVRAFSWAIVLRGGGLLETGLDAALPFDVRIDLVHSYPAIVIGLVHAYLPYAVLTAYLAVQGIDDALIEAARGLGAGRLQALARVVLPLAAPGIAAGAVLVFVPVVGSFMEPRVLGGTAGTVYGTLIEDQFTAVYNWPLGAALSFVLLAVVLLALALGAPVLRRTGA